VPTVRFGAVTFSYVPESGWCESVWPDGARLPGFPEDTESYRQTARELGYGGDTARMCWVHEASHHLLSVAAGLPFSPTLRGEAVDRHTLTVAQRHREEADVLAFQRYLNTGEVSAALAEYLAGVGVGVTAAMLRERWEKVVSK
jgi:hypothetical protein